jgi:transposase
VIAALCGGKLFAPMSFDGMRDRFVVISWLKQVLLPIISAGYTIIMDNASFHKCRKIAELIAAADCNALFLPPYSPRFNPIENRWSPLKTNIKKSFDDFLKPTDAVDFILNKKCT